MEKIKVFAVVDQESYRFELKSKLTHDDIAFIGFSKIETALEKALSLMPNAVLIVHEPSNDSCIDLAKKIYVTMPGCAVLLLRNKIDIEALEKAMHAGVRKVMDLGCPAPLLIDQIKLAVRLERSRVENYSSDRTGVSSRLIAVFGAKGGLGKTTIVTNLAVALAHAGKKVIVVDLDLQFGDVNLFFDLDPRDTIAELVQDKQSLDIDTIRSFIKLHSSGVSVLCAPKSPEYAEMIKGEHIEKIISTIRPYYDFILVDTPPIFNETTISALENSDDILLTITLDIPTLRNTRITMDILDSLQQKDKVSILVNHNAPNMISMKDAQNILDFPIKYKMSNDWKTATAALNKGVPVVIDAPRTVLSHEFTALGRAVMTMAEASGN